MPHDPGQYFNWYHRHWHDWPEVVGAVYEAAKAHARYLGYEVHWPASVNAYHPYGCNPPPGDLGEAGPVARIKLVVFRRSGKHRQPIYEDLYVDVERRAGKFHPKRATTDSE
jgi:hypothetical protein